MAGILGIYGLIVAVILSGSSKSIVGVHYCFVGMTLSARANIVTEPTLCNTDGTGTCYTYKQGFQSLAAGLSCGISGLGAGMAIGIVGDAGVRAVGQQDKLFVVMILVRTFDPWFYLRYQG